MFTNGLSLTHVPVNLNKWAVCRWWQLAGFDIITFCTVPVLLHCDIHKMLSGNSAFSSQNSHLYSFNPYHSRASQIRHRPLREAVGKYYPAEWFLATLASWLYGCQCRSICWSPTLVQTEKPQLLDRYPLNSVHTIMVPQRMNPNDAEIPRHVI